MIISRISTNRLNIIIMLFLVSLLVFAGGCKRTRGKLAPGNISFTPASGMVGDTVTITGKNFSTTSDKNTVKFNGTDAVVTSATATQIVTTVPEGATTGKITVTTNGLTATSSADFTVTPLPPAVISLPAFGGAYDKVINEQKREIPCYWIGTERTDLPLEDYVDGFAISPTVIVGTTVYAAGEVYDEETDEQIPCYWAGSTLHVLPLPDDGGSVHVSGIAVLDGVVYTVGFYYGGESGTQAVYWKGDDEIIELVVPEDVIDSQEMASGITVSDGKVYISGSYLNEYTDLASACYWEITADEPQPEPVSMHAPEEAGYDYTMGYAIAVSGDNVYVAGGYGGYNGYPCYWTNGADPVILAEPEDPYNYQGHALSIAASEGSLYVGVMENQYDDDSESNISTPWYWKDGERTDLIAPTDALYTTAITMSVIGDTVYSGGSYEYQNPDTESEDIMERACYWTGANPTPLEGIGYYSAIRGFLWGMD